MRKCRICRNIGHDRRTCPTLASQNIAGQSISTTVSTMPSRPKRMAKCGFCWRRRYNVDTTHNVRNCPERKKDLSDFIEKNKVWAKTFKEAIKNKGFGIGTIVSKNDTVSIIERINWEDISYLGTWGGYQAKRIEHIGDDNYNFWYTTIPDPVYYENDTHWDVKVLSPISPDKVESQFPPDWENGMYGIPDYLRDSATVSRKKKTDT